MPTTKPQKSVNLDPEDHALAGRVADAIKERLTKEYAGTPAETTFQKMNVGIKGAIHYGLIRAAQEMGVE